MRILGLDVGSKRIGVAVSDALGLTAQGIDTVAVRSQDDVLDRIVKIVRDYEVSEIVVGMPYTLDGDEGIQAAKVREFMKLIGERVEVPLREWDERLSSAAAERVLLEADMSRAKRRKVVDKLAAVLILQGYLDMHRSKGS